VTNPVKVYCLFATLPAEEDSAPWMIAAVDEHSWEGGVDGRHGERTFEEARAKAKVQGWEVREVWFNVDYGAVAKAFGPVEDVPAEISKEQPE
jgi:hypothetical protein